MIYAATERLTMTTPYYVPDQSLHVAICSAAERGVAVNLVLPARNDSAIVGAASESLLPELLHAGVHVHLFRPGLIHSKIVDSGRSIRHAGHGQSGSPQFRPELRKLAAAGLPGVYPLNWTCANKAMLTAQRRLTAPMSRHGRFGGGCATTPSRWPARFCKKKAPPAWEDARGVRMLGDCC